MEDKVYKLEDYYKLLELQKKYDNDEIDEDEMTLKEINDLIKLYRKQIKQLIYENRDKLVERKGENND